jgi:hypothetical protein
VRRDLVQLYSPVRNEIAYFIGQIIRPLLQAHPCDIAEYDLHTPFADT